MMTHKNKLQYFVNTEYNKKHENPNVMEGKMIPISERKRIVVKVGNLDINHIVPEVKTYGVWSSSSRHLPICKMQGTR